MLVLVFIILFDLLTAQGKDYFHMNKSLEITLKRIVAAVQIILLQGVLEATDSMGETLLSLHTEKCFWFL